MLQLLFGQLVSHLILVPFMSIIRGYFQGHENMEPTAISQVIEQIVRIVFLLSGVFVVLKVMDGDLVTAISIATFAATVGAVGWFVCVTLVLEKKTADIKRTVVEDRGTWTNFIA